MTNGGSVLENRYGLDRCLNKSINAFGPAVYPPAAPPNAFPNVELITSICPVIPKCSSVPRPVGPKNLQKQQILEKLFLINHSTRLHGIHQRKPMPYIDQPIV